MSQTTTDARQAVPRAGRLASGFASLPKPNPHAVGTAVVLSILMGLMFWTASPTTRLDRLAAAKHWTAEQGPKETRQISYTDGMRLLRTKKVAKAVEEISDMNPTRAVELTMKDGSERWFLSTPGKGLDEAIEGSGADVKMVNANLASHISMAMSLGSSLLVILLFGFMILNTARKFFSSPTRVVRPGKNAVRFTDVEGQPEAIATLREVIAVRREPERFKLVGARMPAGLLMVGPPGNGKTLLAKAMAAEAGMPFLAVSGSDFLEMLAGLGARRVRAMFKQARRMAKHGRGCVLFVDEFDQMAHVRSQGGGSDVAGEKDQTLTALLVELDGMEKREGVYLMAATNRPDILDPAVTRPGRLDKRVEVIPPDAAARGRILAIHCRGLKLADGVDVDGVGRSMPGVSGADLANLANMAALAAVRTGRDTVDDACFQEARDEMLMGEARLGVEQDPGDLDLAAGHEAGHALLAILQEECDPVYKATIVERKASLGMVVTLAARDVKTMSRARIAAVLTVMMAGRAAEEHVNGADAMTTGAGMDIREATRIAREAVGRYGMHPDTGMMDYVGDGRDTRQASPEAMERMDRAVAAVLDACHRNAVAAIATHRAAHAALTAELRERFTLTGDEARAIVAAHAVPDAGPVRAVDPWAAAARETGKAEEAIAA